MDELSTYVAVIRGRRKTPAIEDAVVEKSGWQDQEFTVGYS